MEFHSYSSTCAFKSVADIKNKKVTVMGLGLNGGGEAAVRFFLKHGAYVIATDMKSEEQLKPTIDRINNDTTLDTSRLTYRLGEHRIEDFQDADCVIKNPGVKYQGNKFLAAAKAIETDLSIFLRFTNCPIIAVTGSKGKSSTVSSIYYGLKQAGYKTFLGGNITVSPLTFFDEVTEETPVVIEFSSWQLADLRGRKVLRPYISIITKIVPDHQNWYGNMEDYVADKRLIYADQTPGDYSIFDSEGDVEGTGPACGGTWGDLFARETKATVLRYGKSDLRIKDQLGVWQDTDENGNFCGKVCINELGRIIDPKIILGKLSVPGNHMKTNVLNAALVMYLMKVPEEKILKICESWTGIEHRLQYFHSWKNPAGTSIKFYNDSCATVPEASAAAISAFEKPVTLITGGTDKGLELTPLADALKIKKTKNIFLLAGSATDKITPELDKNDIKYFGPYNNLTDLLKEVRVQAEKYTSKEDEIVVFSPGATSFGMFANEFDRGEKYMKGVKEIF